MHKSRVSAIIIDVNDLEVGTAFWTGALGAKVEWENESYRLLGRAMANLSVFLQLVPDEKLTKNRVHVDFETSDLDAELKRLEELGARRVAERDGWWVMADPFGNEFCVTTIHTKDFEQFARTWE